MTTDKSAFRVRPAVVSTGIAQPGNDRQVLRSSRYATAITPKLIAATAADLKLNFTGLPVLSY